MLNNPGDCKVTIDKGSIGYTLEEICQKTQKYTLIDNVAFLDVLTETATDFNHIFHVTEKIENTNQTLENPKLDKTDIRQKLKKAQKNAQEKEFVHELDHHELETDFSQDLKELRPKETIEGEIRPQQIPPEKLETFSKSDREFLKKFDFSQSDINDAQLLDLMKLLARDKEVYSQHKYNVGKIKQKFHVKLLPNSTLTKQRPSRVPLHHQEKLEILLNHLCKAGIIREMGDETEMGSSFINPVIILPKGNIVKLVIDARYLNSITDLSKYSWPLEPIGSLLTRLNGNYFTTSDLCSAYNQVPLTEETQQLTSFVIGSKQYTFQRGFYGLCGLPNFFSRIMTIHFAPLIKSRQAVTYIDDTIMQAQDS